MCAAQAVTGGGDSQFSILAHFMRYSSVLHLEERVDLPLFFCINPNIFALVYITIPQRSRLSHLFPLYVKRYFYSNIQKKSALYSSSLSDTESGAESLPPTRQKTEMAQYKSSITSPVAKAKRLDIGGEHRVIPFLREAVEIMSPTHRNMVCVVTK